MTERRVAIFEALRRFHPRASNQALTEAADEIMRVAGLEPPDTESHVVAHHLPGGPTVGSRD